MAGTAWRLQGQLLECCNCDPGCGCNFTSFPSSKEGNCEAFVVYLVDQGRFGQTDLAQTTLSWALWWPGAIHERGGKGHAYIDCSSDEQYEVLARIMRGEEGYAFFEIFNSTFDEPTAVDRTRVDVTLNGKRSRFSIEGVGSASMAPLTSPVTGEENDVRIVKPDGFIWKDGEIVQSEISVKLPEMSFEVSGRHGVVAPFDWSVEG